jgi:hypothetical protein
MTNKGGRKKGKNNQDYKNLWPIYCEFLMYKEAKKYAPKDSPIREQVNQWSKLNGYSDTTEKAFTEKHNINIDTTTDWRKKPEFWDLYAEECLMGQKPKLPIVLSNMANRYPKEWLQVIYKKIAQESFKEQVDHNVKIAEKWQDIAEYLGMRID